MSARGRATVSLVALILGALFAAPAARAQGTAGSLAFEGRTHVPRVATLHRAGEVWKGQMTVVARSDARVRGLLRVRYFPARGEPVRLVGRVREESRFVEALRPRRKLVRMRPGQLLAILLELTVPAGNPLSAVDGTLVADLRATPGDVTPRPAQLQITGAMPTIRFAPGSVRLRVLRGCWLVLGTCGDEAKVTVRGDSLAAMAQPDVPLGHVLLRNGDGVAARVQLIPDDSDGEVVRTGDAVEATLKASEFESVGELAGALALEPGPDGGPALPVTVTVGHSLALAVFTVLLGASLGGWLVQRAGVRRKRRLLELELRSALERFDDELHASDGQPASYDLSGFLEPRPRPGVAGRPYPGKHGAAALVWAIRTAQDEEDFQDVIARTDDMVARIERWIGLERVARATSALLRSEPPKRGADPFSKCLAYRETELLLEQARQGDPHDDAQAERLRALLADEGVLLGKWKVLWELHRALESSAAQDPEVARALESDAIEEKLAEAREAEIEARVPPREKRTARDVVDLKVTLKRAANAVAEVTQDLGLKRPERIQERLDSAARLTAQLEQTAQDPALPRATKPPESVLSRRYLLQVLRDQLWTLARASVAAAAYALTIYDETWGTAVDYASAFTTGFLSETIVNWAVMPALQSYRVRSAGARKSDAEQKRLIGQLETALVDRAVPGGNGTPPADETGAPAAR